MTNRIPFLVLGLACGVGLTLGAQRLHPGAARAAPSEPTGEQVVVAPAPPAASVLALDGLARRLERIEQKLDGGFAAAAPEQQKVEAAQAEATLLKGASPADRAPEQQEAFDRGAAIVEGALRAGVWVDTDQRAMRDLVAQLLPADRFTLRNRLGQAGNQDHLRDLAHEPRFF